MTKEDSEYHRKRGAEIVAQIQAARKKYEEAMTQGLFDDAPIFNSDRDEAWEAFIKRKDVKRLMHGKEDFKFPLDGSYDIWCLCWDKAWDAGFKAGWEAHEEFKKVKT